MRAKPCAIGRCDPCEVEAGRSRQRGGDVAPRSERQLQRKGGERERGKRALPHLRCRRLCLCVRPSLRRSGFLRLKASAVDAAKKKRKTPPLYRVQIKQLHYSSPLRYVGWQRERFRGKFVNKSVRTEEGTLGTASLMGLPAWIVPLCVKKGENRAENGWIVENKRPPLLRERVFF